MFGLFQGPSSQEQGQFNLLNSQTNFATGLGEKNLVQSSQFFSDLLTNPMKALAPEVSAEQGMVKNQAKTGAEFGTRSGGTGAATRAAGDKARGDIINLMGRTQSGAAANLASTGGNLLNTGVSGAEAGFGEAKTMQEQKANMWNDIIKSSLAVAAAPFTGGTSLSGAGAESSKWSVPDWMTSWFGGGTSDQAPYGPNSD